MPAKKKQDPKPQEEGWEEVVESWDEIFTFTKKDDTLEGVLRSKVEGVGPNDSTVYVIERDDTRWGIWGSAILDNRMKNVNPKDQVKIVYLGEAVAPKSKREYHDYKVMVRGTRHAPQQLLVDDIPF